MALGITAATIPDKVPTPSGTPSGLVPGFDHLEEGLGDGSLRTEDFEALVDAALGGQALDWGQIRRNLSSLPASNAILDSAGHSVAKRSPVNPFVPIKLPIVAGTCAFLKTLSLPIFPVAWPPIYKKCFVFGNLSTGLGR